MTQMFIVLCATSVLALSGCAASAPVPPPLPSPALRSGPITEVRRLAVVASGESKFTMPSNGFDVRRVFGEVAKWYPKAALFAPLVQAVQAGVDWFVEQGRSAATGPQVRALSPGSLVADAFARTLMASGRFDQVRAFEREPTGEDRQHIETLVRLTVPAWGIVRVREGKPDLMAGYADVRAQVIVRPTGVVLWEHDEDVTHAERLPLQALTSDGALMRQEMTDVLERAGQRLANEFLYAQSARR